MDTAAMVGPPQKLFGFSSWENSGFWFGSFFCWTLSVICRVETG